MSKCFQLLKHVSRFVGNSCHFQYTAELIDLPTVKSEGFQKLSEPYRLVQNMTNVFKIKNMENQTYVGADFAKLLLYIRNIFGIVIAVCLKIFFANGFIDRRIETLVGKFSISISNTISRVIRLYKKNEEWIN